MTEKKPKDNSSQKNNPQPTKNKPQLPEQKPEANVRPIRETEDPKNQKGIILKE